MKYLIREMLKPLYFFTKNKYFREFYRLRDKWEEHERYQLVEKVDFLSYEIKVPDTASFLGQYKEIFLDEIYYFDTFEAAPVIYDCGANIGTGCLYFKSKYPKAKIKAFEADAQIANILKHNLKQNGIEDIDVIEQAVWVHNKGISFVSDGADGGSLYGEGKQVKVESLRLKDMIEKEKRIDFLKIDIEGAEYEVLLDCKNSLGHVERLFVEYHSWCNTEQKLSEILDVFEVNGFRYYIDGLTHVSHPLEGASGKRPMDLQLNIFGSKKR